MENLWLVICYLDVSLGYLISKEEIVWNMKILKINVKRKRNWKFKNIGMSIGLIVSLGCVLYRLCGFM